MKSRSTPGAGSPGGIGAVTLSQRADALAVRLEQGALALANLVSGLTDAEWQTRVPDDERKIGIVVHYVATMYPLEIQAALTLAAGKPITGMIAEVIDEINARHARENDAVTKDAALDLLQRNSAAAAEAIRALGDEELDRAAPVSLNDDAPLTCQFMLEDHAVRHSYHHLALIRKALGR
ncbi:MAG TPA: DinB family protein [Gemmatimonadales bacterium]|nr:DinB family protein [Gemmatimonadales bacterium]